jgi:hypothetical protein
LIFKDVHIQRNLGFRQSLEKVNKRLEGSNKIYVFYIVQPALAKDQSPVPLVIMSYPEPLQEQQFQSFKDWVYTNVYSFI